MGEREPAGGHLGSPYEAPGEISPGHPPEPESMPLPNAQPFIQRLPFPVGLLFAFLLGGMAGCDRSQGAISTEDGQLQGRITITGSSTMAPLVAEVGRRFEGEHPEVRVDVQTGGSSQGMADVRRGTAQIGMISRALRPEESELNGGTIAMDGIAFIVHEDNGVTELTHDAIVGIFTGTIHRWNDVGAGEGEITVVNKANGRATLEVFLDHFQLSSDAVRPSVIIGENQQGIRTVVGDPGAIAYVSIGTATYEAARGTPIRLPAVDGVEPTMETVGSGVFPLVRPLTLVTQQDLNPVVAAFLAYAASAHVHDLVEGHYFVPVQE